MNRYSASVIFGGSQLRQGDTVEVVSEDASSIVLIIDIEGNDHEVKDDAGRGASGVQEDQS
ncbi:MAG: hypothetical protein GXX95_11475 [Methanomassiliicoccus sp.]|nr:hypothetical protein [Methanomassiliicoccus sp.]